MLCEKSLFCLKSLILQGQKLETREEKGLAQGHTAVHKLIQVCLTRNWVS